MSYLFQNGSVYFWLYPLLLEILNVNNSNRNFIPFHAFQCHFKGFYSAISSQILAFSSNQISVVCQSSLLSKILIIYLHQVSNLKSFWFHFFIQYHQIDYWGFKVFWENYLLLIVIRFMGSYGRLLLLCGWLLRRFDCFLFFLGYHLKKRGRWL